MANKPSIPKGTRDFSPQEMLRRQYIFDTIRGVFQRYGYMPLETPAMENLETLTGKYGEEGDRLIFKILNSGDAWKSVAPNVKEMIQAGEEVPPGRLASELAEKALRYDLTVPFARYVVQHQHEITFPFKRFQIQPVWRADRPQKGRYREFYQCDADVIGSTSLLNEVELSLMILDVFKALGLSVRVHLNNRKILQGLGILWGVSDRLVEAVTILDKYDKVGLGVMEDYEKAGFSTSSMERIRAFLSGLVKGTSGQENIHKLWNDFGAADITVGQEGLKEIDSIQQGVVKALGSDWSNVTVDLSLARGLDYYTGAIFEVKAAEGSLQSSICGGGRYDDLTGIFGLKNVSGVGISFGADRIYDVLLETKKFPESLGSSTRVLFANFGEQEAMHCLKLLRKVREAGIAAELYPDAVKMAKQFKYADDKGIAYVAIIGENELKEGTVTIKELSTGTQRSVGEEELVSTIAG